jgi:acetoacetyl-CoA reductase/3-oxoacyl-[acyl-carrier protein] reductase
MIIITGASRGIGHYLLQKLLSENKDIIGVYNTTSPSSDKVLMYKVDITKPEQIKKFIAKLKPDIKKIILINCAGTNYNAFAHKADLQKWTQVINVNLVGTFNMINAFLPLMREQNYGRIINFCSIIAQIGVPGTSAYASSKAGLWGLTKAISVENASKGITINNLNLGYFQIGMIDQVPIDMQNKIKLKIPEKEFGNPAEILIAVKYLIDSSYITGTSININGGLF